MHLTFFGFSISAIEGNVFTKLVRGFAAFRNIGRNFRVDLAMFICPADTGTFEIT